MPTRSLGDRCADRNFVLLCAVLINQHHHPPPTILYHPTLQNQFLYLHSSWSSVKFSSPATFSPASIFLSVESSTSGSVAFTTMHYQFCISRRQHVIHVDIRQYALPVPVPSPSTLVHPNLLYFEYRGTLEPLRSQLLTHNQEMNYSIEECWEPTLAWLIALAAAFGCFRVWGTSPIVEWSGRARNSRQSPAHQIFHK